MSAFLTTILSASRTPTSSVLAITATLQDLADRVTTALRETLGPPLKSIQQPIDTWLGTLPMSLAMTCAIGLFVIAMLWVWRIRREFIFRGAPDNRWWRDLRIWATVVLIPYITVYLLLGL